LGRKLKYIIRRVIESDLEKILALYKLVSNNIGGLARTYDEINKNYIEQIHSKSKRNGLQFIIQENLKEDKIIAEIHGYKLEPKVFSHVLSEITIVVHPDYQGKGLGKEIFQHLLNDIQNNRKDIVRVELIARESNQKAIELYQKLGFSIEGKMKNRIKNLDNSFEADIMMAWFREVN
jgi:ribosomal protein S18 acetylase RimI-like enzyme